MREISKVVAFSFLLSCSLPHKTTKINPYTNPYTVDATGWKLEINMDSIFKNKGLRTLSHYNFDSLNKIYHFQTAVLRYDTLFLPELIQQPIKP